MNNLKCKALLLHGKQKLYCFGDWPMRPPNPGIIHSIDTCVRFMWLLRKGGPSYLSSIDFWVAKSRVSNEIKQIWAMQLFSKFLCRINFCDAKDRKGLYHLSPFISLATNCSAWERGNKVRQPKKILTAECEKLFFVWMVCTWTRANPRGWPG